MTKDEALTLALEALEVANSCVDGYYIPKGKTQLPEVKEAITAIKEALAQPEQKPKAWKHFTKPLERRLEHLQLKEHQNSFDKHEIFALKHVLWVVKQPKQKPLSKD
jgi:hypothetical protein